MTFAELKAEVERRLTEGSATHPFFPPDDIGNAINEAYDELADATECIETNGSINLVANQTYYNLASLLTGFLTIKRVKNAQTNRWLSPTHWRELDASPGGSWQTVEGAPEHFFMRGMFRMGVFPAAPTSSGTLTVRYSKLPTALSLDADEPTIPLDFQWVLVDYALYDLLCQGGEHKKALRYYARYKEGEEKLRWYVKSRAAAAREMIDG